jgi:acetyl-CoA carboxylase biotin carboxylase subunit
MIKKVLVSNRGEIAVRIMRSCREMGIRTVGIFSEADRTALHVRYADEVYCVGESESIKSYLNMGKIIEVAKRSGADAIHPGYGFLSENPEFSDRCKQADIIFIGPSAYSISIMGDKITSRKTMVDAGVRVVPGTEKIISIEDDSTESDFENYDKTITQFVEKIGFPVIIKASAGGGGKGMRLVKIEDDLIGAVRAAKAEALSSFGSDSVYIEKYIESPHHIEFQILADNYGNVIHLCERECSVQRRHQKVVEETPSPLMTSELRQEMGQQAITVAKAVNYQGAGTVEFLVDDNRNYYFLEMNTRLQVEHPITEFVIGIDLVKEQIKIAEGMKLSHKQEDIKQHGHSIECRIYAEDTDNNFIPSVGVIKHLTEPYGPGVRCDGYVYQGYEIPVFYDPLISKLIVWERERKDAIKRMLRALHEYNIIGVKNNIKFLEKILITNDFSSGKYNTHIIENNKDVLFSETECPQKYDDIAIITAYLDYVSNMEKNQPRKSYNNYMNKWKDFGRRKSVIRL